MSFFDLPDRGLGVLVLDLRRFDDSQILVVVDQIGTHLLGTPAYRSPEAPRVGCVLRATRRGCEEVHRVSVDLTLLEVGCVFGHRVGVVVIDVIDVLDRRRRRASSSDSALPTDSTSSSWSTTPLVDAATGSSTTAGMRSGGFGFGDVVISDDRDLAGQFRDGD